MMPRAAPKYKKLGGSTSSIDLLFVPHWYNCGGLFWWVCFFANLSFLLLLLWVKSQASFRFLLPAALVSRSPCHSSIARLKETHEGRQAPEKCFEKPQDIPKTKTKTPKVLQSTEKNVKHRKAVKKTKQSQTIVFSQDLPTASRN